MPQAPRNDGAGPHWPVRVSAAGATPPPAVRGRHGHEGQRLAVQGHAAILPLARFIAISYNPEVRTVSYTAGALRDLKRHGNVAGRVRKAVAEYAADPQAHANNVTQLVGSPFQRIRVGDFRAIFEATDTAVIVVKVAPPAKLTRSLRVGGTHV